MDAAGRGHDRRQEGVTHTLGRVGLRGGARESALSFAGKDVNAGLLSGVSERVKVM